VIVGGALVLGAAELLCAVALPESPSLSQLLAPGRVLIGVGTGAITTGVSTAAALSVAPQRLAAAVGLNRPASRSVARSASSCGPRCSTATGSGSGVGPIADIHLFCTLATFAVAAAALWLVLEEKT
jgi:hypothetical protein